MPSATAVVVAVPFTLVGFEAMAVVITVIACTVVVWVRPIGP